MSFQGPKIYITKTNHFRWLTWKY